MDINQAMEVNPYFVFFFSFLFFSYQTENKKESYRVYTTIHELDYSYSQITPKRTTNDNAIQIPVETKTFETRGGMGSP